MKLFLPYRGEFGIACWFHAPQVHHAIEVGVDIVCCEPGREALYPGAGSYVSSPSRQDDERRAALEGDVCALCPSPRCESWIEQRVLGPGHMVDVQMSLERVAPNMDAPRRYFAPLPHVLQGVFADVVVCPRRRSYGEDKNWPHWQGLIDVLGADGWTVFAAGAPDSSFDVHGCARAWDYARCLDASIQAMHSAYVVVATDAGLAHLAVLCGRPLLMVTHGKGLVAPGRDDRGKPYWPVKMERYQDENHTGSHIDLLHHAWEDPGVVAMVAQAWLASASIRDRGV